MQQVASENDGYRYILNVIDCFSRYGWSKPLKNKTGKELVRAFGEILDTTTAPNLLQVDRGTEFYNKDFKNLLKEKNITMFSTDSPTKASLVERWNRTMKNRMWRHFTRTESFRWIDVLQNLVTAYNNSYHRSIKMAPVQVSYENAATVHEALYGQSKKGTPAFKIGDTVRISKARRDFHKGYLPGYTEEYFVVDKVMTERSPIVYKLKDLLDEEIGGVFYRNEIQKVIKSPDDVFKINKVLQKTKTRALVSWVGWPDKFNSWVPINTLKALR
jgi:hypothetical protein